MKTHTRGGQSGLTLIELLVTIIIAGIAFAAILPVFVQALQSNSADKTRNVALNISQAKMELIRELDFAQIDATTPDPVSTANPKDPMYLGSPTFHNGDFAPTYQEAAAGGDKTFWVHYTVTPFKNAPVDSEPSYKRVRVEVGWNGNPKPLKTAVLETIIYSQWGGPRIAYFNVGPLDADNIIRTTGNIRLKAMLNPADIQRTTVVKFAITSLGGEVVPWQEGKVDPADATGGTWYFDWPAAGATDEGEYTFQAIAYDGIEAGNTASRTYTFDSGSPGGPTGLVGYPGNTTALLRWDPSVVGDLAHYEVWQIKEAEYDPLTAIDLQQPKATRVDGDAVLSQPLYLATGLTNDTLYLFFVRAVDSLGNFSDWAQCTVTPKDLDQPLPAAPTDLWLSVIGPTATLSWTPSADAAFYRIYTWNGAAATLVPGEAGISLSSSKSISQGFSGTAYYQVRGVDSAGNEQLAWCTLRAVPVTPSAVLDDIIWATATTLAPPQFNMTLQNMLSQKAAVTVVWLQDGPSTAPARQVTVSPNNLSIVSGQTKDLKTQFAGLYRITWTSAGTDANANGDRLYNFNSAMRIAIPVP